MTKSRTRMLLAGAAALALIALPAALLAHPPGKRGHGFARHLFMDRILERLEVTPAQQEQILDALGAHHEEMRELTESLWSARRVLAEQVRSETFDEAAIRRLAGDVAALEAEVAVGRAKAHQEMRALLTPEQREEAARMREQWGGIFGPEGPRGPHGRHGRGPGRGPSPNPED